MYLCVLMNKKMHFIGMYEAYFYITLTKFIKKNFHIYHIYILNIILYHYFYYKRIILCTKAHIIYMCTHTHIKFFLKKTHTNVIYMNSCKYRS